jgi:hypothetical protein
VRYAVAGDEVPSNAPPLSDLDERDGLAPLSVDEKVFRVVV